MAGEGVGVPCLSLKPIWVLSRELTAKMVDLLSDWIRDSVKLMFNDPLKGTLESPSAIIEQRKAIICENSN